jgi:hypothetical protein
MATKFNQLLTKQVGHVPFHSSLTKDEKKGTYVVQGKFNGMQVVGTGTSERLAALDFNKQVSQASASNKVRSRG